MPVDITFLRHGETEGNRAGIWQGHGDTPLTAEGRRQVSRLGERMARRTFDLVVSSDLGRAVATAAAATDRFEQNPGFREADIGVWEGRTTAEIRAKFEGEMEAMMAGHDVNLGGGESFSEFSARVETALAQLLSRLDDGQRVLVVAHGGVIGSLIRTTLGGGQPRRRRVARLANTALSTIRIHDDRSRQVRVFNDAAHLGPPAPNGTRVWLIRHGQSEGNVSHRWQGTTDGALTDQGRAQAGSLARWPLPLDALYSSPLQRARDTARAVGHSLGVEVRERSDLTEMAFGSWENHTIAEIKEKWPEDWRSIYDQGEDAPRGATGETFAAAGSRVASAVADITGGHDGEEIGVVTHSAASRAYVCSVLDLDFATRSRISQPDNTSISRVSITDDGPLVEAYNLTPHLED